MINMKVFVVILLTGFVSLWGVAGISGTPHDLSATAWTGDATEDNGELCVYCHTPHAADAAFAGAPIWNKTASTAASGFTLYGTTIANTVAGNAGNVNAPSMACLSCHDGVSAVNSVVNAPGSGLATATANQFIGTGAQALSTIATNATASVIGTDLSNDHPVSIIYTEGKAGLRSKTFNISTWVGATTIQDVLRTNGGVDYVECGSCHDPHNGGDTKVAGKQVAFLRIANTGSALCLGCHDK